MYQSYSVPSAQIMIFVRSVARPIPIPFSDGDTPRSGPVSALARLSRRTQDSMASCVIDDGRASGHIGHECARATGARFARGHRLHPAIAHASTSMGRRSPAVTSTERCQYTPSVSARRMDFGYFGFAGDGCHRPSIQEPPAPPLASTSGTGTSTPISDSSTNSHSSNSLLVRMRMLSPSSRSTTR